MRSWPPVQNRSALWPSPDAYQQATVTAELSLANAIAHVDGSSVALGAHAATMFTYGGNTYVLETVGRGTSDNGTVGAGNTLVELVGIHTEARLRHVSLL